MRQALINLRLADDSTIGFLSYHCGGGSDRPRLVSMRNGGYSNIFVQTEA